MQTGTQMAKSSKAALWTGRVITTVLVLFLLFDAIPKILRVKAIVDATVQAGYPASVVAAIGLTLLFCTILYVIPRTAILGAVLLTGYLGGATATMVRIQNPWFLFPVTFGILAWLGLYLRDERLREFVPLRRK